MEPFPFSYAYACAYAYVTSVHTCFSYFSYAYTYMYVKVWTSPKVSEENFSVHTNLKSKQKQIVTEPADTYY